MRRVVSGIFIGSIGDLRCKVGGMFAVLLIFNVAAWGWALMAFQSYPLLLGTALLAYTFGLRHAVDADHIAAIDNVTRKLMQGGGRPVAVGLYFSLGHSSIVVLASAAIAAATTAFGNRIEAFHAVGGAIGTLVSVVFLLAVAAMNMVIFATVYRTFRRVRAGVGYRDEDLDTLLAGRGILVRLFRPLFAMIRRSWHMFPLGVLFGLGFDTATEVGLLGISATQASHGLPVWAIMVFPALFAAGMSLVDTADNILMLGAYGWAFIKPVRKLYYNMTITLVSVLVALLVGGVEALGLIQDWLALKGPFWDRIGSLNGNLGTVGFAIIGIFVASWVVSVVIYRARGYDRLEVRIG